MSVPALVAVPLIIKEIKELGEEKAFPVFSII